MPAKRTPRQYWTPRALHALGHIWRRLRRVERWVRRNNWGYVIDGARKRYFELKTDLTGGGSATAYVRVKDAVTGDLETDLSTTFTVHDDIGDRENTGRDNVGSGEHGAYGKAEWMLGRWYIYDLECP